MLNVFEPSVGEEEAQAVAEVLASHWIGAGPRAIEFERAWAANIHCSPGHLISLHNCTEGLFRAVEMFTRPGDVVALPAIHFVGAGNAVLRQSRQLALCDVDAWTLNLDPATIPANARAVILNHYGGIPCDVDAIHERQITTIEDAACAPASTYRGTACGTLGDVGLWSFDAMKVLTTGDGGMAWCAWWLDKEHLGDLVRLGLGDETHAIQRDSEHWWEFSIEYTFGNLSRLNDIAAAIGLVQLRRLPELLNRRRQVCAWYDEGLTGLDWLRLRPRCPPDCTDSYCFYWVQCERRDDLALYLRQYEIYTTFKYWPLHWAYGLDGSYPGAEQAARTTLLLPCHANLSENDVQRVCDLVRKFEI